MGQAGGERREERERRRRVSWNGDEAFREQFAVVRGILGAEKKLLRVDGAAEATAAAAVAKRRRRRRREQGNDGAGEGSRSGAEHAP